MSKNSNGTGTNREKILKIATGGICIALAFVLSQIKLFSMPMGGSVTPASSLPIVVCSVAFGPVWGFVVAFIFSLLQLIGGVLVSPFQVLLDYTIGFTALGFAGFAAPGAKAGSRITNALFRYRRASLVKILVFTIAAYVVRWLGSVVSGVIFWGDYAAEAGFNSALIYSIVYNGSFLLAELGILIAVLIIFYFAIPSRKASKTEA